MQDEMKFFEALDAESERMAGMLKRNPDQLPLWVGRLIVTVEGILRLNTQLEERIKELEGRQ